MKGVNMNPNPSNIIEPLRPEYDFSLGVRGKHHAAYQQGTNIVFLDPDVAEVFHDSTAVNEALRALVRIAKEQAHIHPA